MVCHLDFETRSVLDVTRVGAYKYASHPSTDIICIAWATGPDVQFSAGCTNLKPLYALAADPTVTFCAHNAGFEFAIWHEVMVPKYDAPPIAIERWDCTAARAAKMNLPRKLEHLAKILDLPQKKDPIGHKAMMKLTSPQEGRFLAYEDCPETYELCYAYNKQDVRTEMAVDEVLPPLTEREKRIWRLDHKINSRGIEIDIPAVKRIIQFVDASKNALEEEFRYLTEGKVHSPNQQRAMLEWLSGWGCDMPDLRADTVARYLKLELHEKAHRALVIRSVFCKNSFAKFHKMVEKACDDNRIYDEFLFMAGITHRWGGRGVQVQNLTKSKLNGETVLEIIQDGGYRFFRECYPNETEAYAACVRSVIKAKDGHEFYSCDFSAIEARVTAWYAGQWDVIDAFKCGEDVYCAEASAIFARPVTKKDPYGRGIGKVSVLGLGFGGGINAYGTMARTLQVDITPVYHILWPTATEDEKQRARQAYQMYYKRNTKTKHAEDFLLGMEAGYAADIIKQRFRQKNAKIKAFWHDVENAAIMAVLNGEKYSVGGIDGRPLVTFGMLKKHLICRLPSGDVLCYPFARVGDVKTDWGAMKLQLSYRTQRANKYGYARTHTYGGKLTENIVQATSWALLAESMLRCEDAGFPTVHHCHDENNVEMPVGVDRSEEFRRLMTITPSWAPGLPLDGEVWVGKRYRK